MLISAAILMVVLWWERRNSLVLCDDTEPRPPTLIEELKDIEVVGGEDRIVELSCVMSAGRPRAMVQWYCQDEMISGADDIEFIDDNTMKLRLFVQPSYSAIYRCDAANEFGQVTTTCRLQVTCT